MKNPFKKPIDTDAPSGKEPERPISAVAVIRSNDPYVFEFELFILDDARIEDDGRVSFSMTKDIGPYGMTSICTHAYSRLIKRAFLNGSKKKEEKSDESNS